jgi:hypothetical protein
MAEARPGEKSEPAPPTPPALSPCNSSSQTRPTDSSGEWEVVGRPFTTAGGKNAHVRFQRVNQPGVTDIRTWGTHKKVSVKRA